VRSSAAEALGKLGATQATDRLVKMIEDPNPKARCRACWALDQIGNNRGYDTLLKLLKDEIGVVRTMAMASIVGKLDVLEVKLLSQDLDGDYPWLDPMNPITEARVSMASNLLDMDPCDIRFHYQSLAEKFDFKLGWVT
jgi:HEAT repeat protein